MTFLDDCTRRPALHRHLLDAIIAVYVSPEKVVLLQGENCRSTEMRLPSGSASTTERAT